jgi:hypothetical protein
LVSFEAAADVLAGLSGVWGSGEIATSLLSKEGTSKRRDLFGDGIIINVVSHFFSKTSTQALLQWRHF